MAKPDEVLITLDENGQPIRQEEVDTENIALYKLLKDLLINLSKLDWENMRQIL